MQCRTFRVTKWVGAVLVSVIGLHLFARLAWNVIPKFRMTDLTVCRQQHFASSFRSSEICERYVYHHWWTYHPPDLLSVLISHSVAGVVVGLIWLLTYITCHVREMSPPPVEGIFIGHSFFNIED